MPTATQETRIAELTANLDRVRADQQIRILESQLGMASEVDRLFETADAFAYSDPTRRSLTQPGNFDRFLGGRPDDYKDGKCWPLYETEQDLQELRSIGRWFANWDEMGVAMVASQRNYTIRDGFNTECKPKDDSAEAKQLAAEVQSFNDEFDDVNNWLDDGESEAYTTAIIDGDLLLRLKPRGANAPKVQFIGGEHITEPKDSTELEDHYGLPSCCWKFGVATEHGDPTEVIGFFVDWYGRATDWDFVPESESVFIKRNTPRQAKRGVSDFAVIFRTLDRASKLIEFIAIGATCQASIANIQKLPQNTPPDALGGLSNPLGGYGKAFNANGQVASVATERIIGGKQIKTTSDYLHGPMGTPQGPLYLDVYQGVARRVGSTKQQPEYLLTGDASNANYASTMVAESPFVQSICNEQSGQARYNRELRWKAVDMAAKRGRFGGRTVQEIKQLVEISVEGTSPISRDPVAEETVFDKQQAAGVLSRKTRAQRSGLDFDEEIANGAKEAAPAQLVTDSSSQMSEARIRDLRFSLLEGAE